MNQNSLNNIDNNGEEILIEKELRNDFKAFLFYVWKYLGLPKPTRVQYEIAEFLQDTKYKKKMIQALRGVGKSWVTSTYVIWRLWNNPQLEVVVISATGTKAGEFTLFCKRLIDEIPLLQPMRPLPKQRSHRWSQYSFDVRAKDPSPSPSMKAVGIFGQITGSRADLVLSDDVEITENSLTVDSRRKLLDKITEYDNILKPEKDEIIYLGTPQSEESIYDVIKKKKTHTGETMYKIRIWTAQYPEQLESYGGNLSPTIYEDIYQGRAKKGDAVDDRFDLITLTNKKLSIGAKKYALHYMLDTSLVNVDKYALKLKDLIVTEIDKDYAPPTIQWSNNLKYKIEEFDSVGFKGDFFFRPSHIDEKLEPYTLKILVIDPSGRGTDETAYAVLGVMSQKIFIIDFGGLSGGYDIEVLNKLSRKAKDYNVNTVYIESNFGDGMFTQLLKPVLLKYHRCGIEEISNYKQKEKRIIDTLEPLMNQHKLVIDYSATKADLNTHYKSTREEDKHEYSLFYQLTRITDEKGSLRHDDRLDAIAMGCEALKDHMKISEEYTNEYIKQKEYEQLIEDYYGGMGLKTKSDFNMCEWHINR